MFCIFLVFGAVIYRLFLIQVLQRDFYRALAQDQNQTLEKLVPQRGDILMQDKNGSLSPLAVNREYPAVFLVPKEIQEKEKTSEILSGILGIEKEIILNKINKENDPYESLKSRLDDSSAEEISKQNLKGVYLTSEKLRWYPQEGLASHLLGFLGFKGDQKVGRYGVEEYYEEALAGKPGLVRADKDARGKWIMTGDYELEPAQDGSQLVLTIDPNVQFMAEQNLREVLEKWQSPSGSMIVQDPKTGAIKAMVSFPNFNPNEYSKVENIDDFLNPVTQKIFEPGSVFKPITMAAALDTGKINPDTTYVDSGSIQIKGYKISNAADRSYGLSTMTKVLEKSINTGVVFAERQAGDENFKQYVEAFGFNRPTGIDLSGETSGDTRNLKSNREIDFATASFGQGVAVTPLEITTAIGAIANDGKMMRPYVLEKKINSDGRQEITKPEIIRQVISEKTADKLTSMLVSTVRNGYDKIKIKGYFIAGKTGTAQVPDKEKGGYGDQTVHSFVGYAPAYDPKFIIFIKMDYPKGITFASDSLGPVFANMAKYLFTYYEIPPEE